MRTRWTREKTQRLIELFPCMTNKEIGARLRVARESVSSKAQQLGLSKSPEHLAKVRAKALSKRKGRKQCVSRLSPTTP
ncbi:hypothetical protein CG431_08670 [Pantoea ananatis]|nr:hypothetical protein CG431_08670 [Pantoea ananatis]PWK07077.1 hypothetical protein C7421_10828 [Pantoea ananatis]